MKCVKKVGFVGDGRKGRSHDTGSLKKYYPWLAVFDNEAKARLTIPEVTNTHVLKLITLLESNISPEVTKLKNKPNRATKFLGQVQKRLSMAKVGGYMIDREVERELFPTYGLLMTHIVNLTLVSSKIEKFGAQKVASELYYLLKLMFHGNTEYVLDVILCSTLDEHATSKNQVGFQLFSFIVEDWRNYSETHASLMKYCAVSSLLLQASNDGQLFVEQNVPEKIDKEFPKYLSKHLNLTVKKKMSNLKMAIMAIKVTRVKSISRNRLIVVSKKDVTKFVRVESPELSDNDSAASTVLNMSTCREQPTSSTAPKLEMGEDVSNFFSDLGIGFSLDTAGTSSGHNFMDSAPQFINYDLPSDYCLDSGSIFRNQDESCVSSTVGHSQCSAKSANRRKSDNDHKRMPNKKEKIVNLENNVVTKLTPEDDVSDNDELELDEPSNRVTLANKKQNDEVDEGTSSKVNGEYEEMSYEARSDDEQQDKDEVAADGRSPLPDCDDSSDLEVLSVKSMSPRCDLSDGSYERDEAEPESGEDVIPNYDESTSDEEDESDLNCGPEPENKDKDDNETIEKVLEVEEKTNDSELSENASCSTAIQNIHVTSRQNQENEPEHDDEDIESDNEPLLQNVPEHSSLDSTPASDIGSTVSSTSGVSNCRRSARTRALNTIGGTAAKIRRVSGDSVSVVSSVAESITKNTKSTRGRGRGRGLPPTRVINTRSSSKKK